jgi:hypothetical protein
MTKISKPQMLELRWYVMLMMMRVDGSLENIVGIWSEDILNAVHFDGFSNDTLSTGINYVPIKWTLSLDWIVEITVSHSDSKWAWKYTDYVLQKFLPWDKIFVFYAYTEYESLTLNDLNTYTFEFFDKDGKLLFSKVISINQQ